VTLTRRRNKDLPTRQAVFADLLHLYPFLHLNSVTDVPGNNIWVELAEENFFKALGMSLGFIGEDDLKMYALFKILLQTWKYTPFYFRKSVENTGQASGSSFVYSDVDCVAKCMELAPEEMHATFIAYHTKKALNDRMEILKIEKNINSAFQKLVNTSQWITPLLKREVISQAKVLRLYFSPLKSTYTGSTVFDDNGASFLRLWAECTSQKHIVNVMNLGKLLKQVEMDWSSTQMYYDPQFRTLG